jgi:hypothetical protein
MTCENVYLLLKAMHARSWLGLLKLDTQSGRSSTEKSDGIPTKSDEAWLDEYRGREDYTLFKVAPVLRSVVTFEFTQNTYVRVRNSR